MLLAPGNPAGFVDAKQCAACHAEIAKRYAATGMARSFFRLRPSTEAGEFREPRAFYHAASDRHYETRVEKGRYFLLRYQILQGRRINLVEKEIHYVLGSGNHARSYIHRATDGRLIQLPLTWYTGAARYWDMSPGYDRPDHLDFRREIDFECFGCHNAYPEIEAGADRYGMPARFPGRMPEGIDCQRCHGPGERHIAAARKTGSATVRDSIVNPARLSPSLQREICMQCHLETTSSPLPHSILRHDAGWFSYRPGSPIQTWALFFDHPDDSAQREKFEVVSSVYRLRKSACFQGSADRMTCTTCHDPHSPARGEDAHRRYDQACMNCHTGLRQHATAKCAGCHMPKRPAGDAPHVVMTDHLVQRSPASGGAPSQESYRGAVKLYYPESPANDPEAELYEAVAQVRDQSNLAGGIPHLERAIRENEPRTGFFHFELAEALRHAGRPVEAAAGYREALRRTGVRAGWHLGLAHALSAAGDLKGAVRAAEEGRSRWPADRSLANLLGDLYRQAGRTAEAIRILQGVPLELPEAANNLGVALSAAGRTAAAQQAFEEAIRHRPDAASAHNNLAVLLFREQHTEAALHHAETAARLAPKDLPGRLTYATVLARLGRYNQAGAEWESALAIDPNQAETHMNLGSVRRGNGDVTAAIRHYRRAVELKPELAQAHFFLAVCLEQTGDTPASERHYREAIERGLDSGAAHLRLGHLLIRTGRTDEGRRLLQRAQELQAPKQ